jgi:hypothetical protein
VRLTDEGIEQSLPDVRSVNAWCGIDRVEQARGLILDLGRPRARRGDPGPGVRYRGCRAGVSSGVPRARIRRRLNRDAFKLGHA